MVEEAEPEPDCERVTPGRSTTVREATLQQTDVGLIPEGEGWFVLNARDASWIRSEERGQDTDFEGRQVWAQLGFRIQVLTRGQRGIYHGERGQEDFLVVSGECLLVIEGVESAASGRGISSTARRGRGTSSSARATSRA
jgi:hypothetical protein